MAMSLFKSFPSFHLSTATASSDLPPFNLSFRVTRDHSESYYTSSNSRPALVRVHSTPPTSPTKKHMRMDHQALHPSGAMTPPATPTGAKKRPAPLKIDNGATTSQQAATQLSTPETSPRQQECSPISPLSSKLAHPTELKEFRWMITDYDLHRDQKPLGTGAWSTVYLAYPKNSQNSDSAPTSVPPTPPSTPRGSFTSHMDDLTSRLYAIKLPASRSCKEVILSEAKILSYITSLNGSGDYIVPFYGYDIRNGAIVMQALPQNLEDYTTRELRGLAAETRTQKLAAAFPDLALRLLKGLEWLHSNGIVHADIKPGNILLKPTTSSTSTPDTIIEQLSIDDGHDSVPQPSSSTPSPFAPVYADFSAATLTSLSGAPPSSPLAGGTWDYLAPELLSTDAATSTPAPASDVHALAVTLLYVILGCSPFKAAPNEFVKREWVRMGNVMGCAMQIGRVGKEP